jgi:hypothetical protein
MTITVPTTARGVAKTLALLAETSFGVQPTGTAQILRRNQSMMNLQVQEIDSQEILPSQQMRDSRQGTRSVTGQIMAQLSCLTYEACFANLFRNSFAAGVSMTGIASSTLAVNTTSATITITSGSFLTTGFKVGDVVTLSGLVAPVTANNGVYMAITAVTALVMTLALPVNGATITAYSTGQTALGIAVVGKKLIMPANYATASLGSLAFEHWYADVGVSELALGNRITSIGISVPPSGLVTTTIAFTGRQLLTNTVQQFTAPSPVTTTNLLTAVGGVLLLFGAPIGYITGFNLHISAQADAPPVVGSPLTPNIFMGTLSANGSMTMFFANDGISNAFLNEQEFQLQLYLTDNGSANAPNFINIFLPRVKVFSDSKNDSDREITRSVNFRALEQDILGGTGLAYDDTTVTIQDSLAV